MPNNFWKDYFSFSKKERIAVYLLVFFIGASILLPYLYARTFKPPVVDAITQKQLDAILQTSQPDSSTTTYKSNADVNNSVDVSTKATLFYFDPNQLSADGFKQLGLRDKTIQTIINYRNKGGYFKQPEDLRKIYGLHADEAERLIPFVHIENNKHQPQTKDIVPTTQIPKQSFKTIDINNATEEEWKAFPGIGEVLSKRIVKFRNSIHGFKSVNDVKKTYGLPDSTFQSILPYLTVSDSANQ
ncbi:hypothetical protein BH11BAC6_BH11BAC6_11170 [soil metagenome]